MSSSERVDVGSDEDRTVGDSGPLNLRARQKAETRLRILDAAVEVFIEVGPANASFDAIASRAKVSRPSLFFHFGNRTELMDQAIAHIFAYRFEAGAEMFRSADLRSFIEEVLRAQRKPEVRVLWQLGDLLQLERPRGPNDAYWFTVSEMERHLVDAGYEPARAHQRALVLAPALLLVARRAAFDLTTESEERDFVTEACQVALAGLPSRGKR